MEETFKNIHRSIVIWMSTIFGIFTSCVNGVSPSSAADAPLVDHLTLMQWLEVYFSVIFSEEAARIAAGASVGGLLGVPFYIITTIWKRWYYTKYPITPKELKKVIKDIEDDH